MGTLDLRSDRLAGFFQAPCADSIIAFLFSALCSLKPDREGSRFRTSLRPALIHHPRIPVQPEILEKHQDRSGTKGTEASGGRRGALYLGGSDLLAKCLYYPSGGRVGNADYDHVRMWGGGQEWGSSFRPEYRKLGFFRKEFPDIPIMVRIATCEQ